MSDLHPKKAENKTESEVQNDEESDSAQTFTEAVRDKYCFDGTDYTFGSCQITIHGKAGTKGAKAELAHLRNVVLCNTNLKYAGIPREGLASLCPNVIDLDISGNNITSWKEILPIFQQLHHLKFVNLGGNPIQTDQDYLKASDGPISNVENLVLNGTFIQWKEVLKLVKRLPALKEIHVCYNEYEGFGGMEKDDLQNIECFRANNNNIQKWSEVWKLRHLPKLHSLILSGNPVKDIFFDHNCCTGNHDDCQEPIDDLAPESNHQNCDKTLAEASDQKSCQSVSSCDTSESLKDQQTLETSNCHNLSKAQSSKDQNGEKKSADGLTTDQDKGSCNSDLEEEFQSMVSELLKGSENMSHQNSSCNQGNNRYRYQSLQSEDGDYDDCSKEEGNLPEQLANSQEEMSGETLGQLPLETIEQVPTDVSGKMSPDTIEQMPTEALGQMPTDVSGKKSPEALGQMSPEAKEQMSPEEATEAANEEPECRPFQNLHTLCLTETHIHHTDHLEALTKYPSLKSVRLRDVPLYKEHNDEVSWKLYLASLPNIELFNGSEISATDRENSERFYLRHYLDFDEKPRRHEELEQKHGKLSKLVDIDLGGGLQKHAIIQFYINGKKSFKKQLCTRDSIDKLRNFVAKKLNTSKRNFRLYYFPCSPQHVYENGEFPEKEKLVANLPMSRFNMRDGDEIHIEMAKNVQDMDIRVVITNSRWQSRVPRD